jgi:hypothetical protein
MRKAVADQESLTSRTKIVRDFEKIAQETYHPFPLKVEIETISDEEAFVGDSTHQLNPKATRDMENNPIIILPERLLKQNEISTEGIILLMCHELGHHLGGAPLVPRPNGKLSWMSAEGQADYFAGGECWEKIVKKSLEKKTSLKFDLEKAALEVTYLFSRHRFEDNFPVIGQHDTYVTFKTLYQHPTTQCRLDTFIAASISQERPRCWYAP